MQRILVVDDEQHVLDVAADALRMRGAWCELHFSREAVTAMTLIASKPVDIVISDSPSLLEQVKNAQPSAARILMVESGSSDDVLHSFPAAQQFLSKPLDPASVLVAVDRANQVQYLLTNTTIRELVGGLHTLPSVPSLYHKLTTAAAHPEATLVEIAAIIERDSAVSLKILQLVNSPYFGATQRTSSIQQAVARLGVEMIKALALSTHAFGALSTVPFDGFSAEVLQRHSYMTASFAKEVAESPAIATEAFTVALLHDLGKLVLAVAMPKLLAAIIREHRRSRRPHYLIEQESLGVTHAEVGAHLLATWGLPLTLVEAVAHHHLPSAISDTNPALTAVHVADALIDPEPYVTGDAARQGKLDSALIDRAALQLKLPGWRDRVARLHAGLR